MIIAEDYCRAVTTGIRYISADGRFSAPLIVRLHNIATRHLGGDKTADGNVLKDLAALMNHRTGDILLDIAAVQYFFGLLRPFSEGNGTIGRICTLLCLKKHGIIRNGVLPLSRYFGNSRPKYAKLVYGTERGFEEWLDYFLDAAVYECGRTEGFLSSCEEYRRTMGEITKNNRKLRGMPDIIMANPFLRVSDVQNISGVSQPTAASYLAEMESLGLLRETPSGTRWKLYSADGVLKILNM